MEDDNLLQDIFDSLVIESDLKNEIDNIPLHHCRLRPVRMSPLLKPNKSRRGYHYTYAGCNEEHPLMQIKHTVRLNRDNSSNDVLDYGYSSEDIVIRLHDIGYTIEDIAYYTDLTYNEVSDIIDEYRIFLRYISLL